MKIKNFNESYKSQPKFKKGDRCVYVYKVGKRKILSVLDDNMIIEDEPYWEEYNKHSNKGYWCYPIVGKANECPEDFLRLYNGQEEGDFVKENMKNKKITVSETSEVHIESLFYFLNSIKPVNNLTQPNNIEFLKSLNLTYDQYIKLEEIMSDYAKERYDDGRQDGLDQCQDYGEEY